MPSPRTKLDPTLPTPLDMITVIVRQDNFPDIGQINTSGRVRFAAR
jgi:hypothetical protein